MSLPAHTQNTRNIPLANPLRIPSRISSSVSDSDSKEFSIRHHSSAAASIPASYAIPALFPFSAECLRWLEHRRPVPRIFLHQKHNQRIEVRSCTKRILNRNNFRTIIFFQLFKHMVKSHFSLSTGLLQKITGLPSFSV